MPTSDYYSDTHPDAMRVWTGLFRKIRPEQRVASALPHSKMVFKLIEINVRENYQRRMIVKSSCESRHVILGAI